MTALTLLARLPGVETLGWTLAHSLWQGAAIALLLYAALCATRRADPQIRYSAACAALLLFTLCPPVTFSLLGRAAGPGTDLETLRPYARTSVGISASPAAGGMAMAALVALWLGGCLVFSVRLLGGWSRVARLRRSGGEPGAVLYARMRSMAVRFDLGQRITLRITHRLVSPSTYGWIRPVILLPAGALAGLSAAQMDAILAHELAHIRRADYLVNLFQMAAEAVFYYHPAVWWISGVIRNEREFCCDDLAVKITGDAAVYASALATLEEMKPMALSPGMAAASGSLLTRVKRILGRTTDTAGQDRVSSALPALAMAGLVASLAAGLWAGNPAFARVPQDDRARTEQSQTERAALEAEKRALQEEQQALQRAEAAKRATDRAQTEAERARARAERAAQEAARSDRSERSGRPGRGRRATRSQAITTTPRHAEPESAQAAGDAAEQAAREKEAAAASRLDPVEVTPPQGREPGATDRDPLTRRGADDRDLVQKLRRTNERAAVAQRDRATLLIERAHRARQSSSRSADALQARELLLDQARQKRDRQTDETRRSVEQDVAAAERAAQDARTAARARAADIGAARQAREQDIVEARRARDIDFRVARQARQQDIVARVQRRAYEAKIRTLEERTRALERRLQEMERRLQTEPSRSPHIVRPLTPARPRRLRPSVTPRPATPDKPGQPSDPTKKPGDVEKPEIELRVETQTTPTRRP